MQDQPDGYSAKNNFEGSFTEEGTVSRKTFFEGGLKFATSDARKNFNITASSDQGAIGEQLGSDF